MAAARDGSVAVLHVVGGASHLGGVMSFATALAASPIPGVVQHIWKHRDAGKGRPTPENWVCEGAAERTDVSALSDLVGAALEVPALVAWVRRQSCPVLYAHSRLGIIATALATRVTGSPFLLHLHARASRPGLYRRLWQSSRATVLFNSRLTCEYYGGDPNTAWILMPPVSWPAEPPPATRSGHPALRFVAAGLFVAWKNVHVIVDAFSHFKGGTGGQELRLYGNSAELENARYQRQVVEQARFNPAVRLMGWDAGWTGQLAASDIFVHAARDEPFGIVMLEAFARGCRLVVPPQSFLDDLPAPLNSLGIERAARLDAPSFAEAMERAAKAPIPVGGFWEARRKVSALFAAEAHNLRLAKAYRTVSSNG